MVVLLTAKVISSPKEENIDDEAVRDAAQIPKRQRKLAEITDMIHVSHLLHREVLNLNNCDIKQTDLHLGNTISILVGDYLLASASRGLAELRYPYVRINYINNQTI